MPDETLITPLGRAMLAEIPPWFGNDPDVLGVIHAYARELQTLRDSIEAVRSGFFPGTGTLLLSLWEAELGLPVAPPGMPDPQRQDVIVAFLSAMRGDASGLSWEEKITTLVGAGWGYEEHIPGDITSPAEGTLRINFPFRSDSAFAATALALVKGVTDAHLAIEFNFGTGFQLDISEMDVEEFGV